MFEGVAETFKHYAKTVLSVVELVFPRPNKITWLEQMALEKRNAQGAHIATRPQDDYALGIVEEVYQGQGLKAPKLIIYHSDKPNAIHLNNNTLLISDSKLELFTREQNISTIAHESKHHWQNPVSLTATLGRLAAIIGLSNLASNRLTSRLTGSASPQGSTQNKLGQAALATGLWAATAALVHNLTELPFKAFRRQQEREADLHSAQFTGSAEGMISVFERTRELRNKSACESHKSENVPAEAAKPHKEKEESRWDKLNRSHDTHCERIAYLREAEQKGLIQPRPH